MRREACRGLVGRFGGGTATTLPIKSDNHAIPCLTVMAIPPGCSPRHFEPPPVFPRTRPRLSRTQDVSAAATACVPVRTAPCETDQPVQTRAGDDGEGQAAHGPRRAPGPKRP